jgi:low affinity Fe/Cu permease
VATAATIYAFVDPDTVVDTSGVSLSVLTIVLLLGIIGYLHRLTHRDYQDLKQKIEELEKEAAEREDAILAGQLKTLSAVRQLKEKLEDDEPPFELK